MTRRYTTEEIIIKFKTTHGNRYDYSLVEYTNSKSKVKVICREHGEFMCFPPDHINGVHCVRCAVENRRATCLDKYGTTSVMKVKEVVDKGIQVMRDKFGGHPMSLQEYKDKVINTCNMRYGVDNPMQCNRIKDKVFATNISRYGAKNATQNINIQNKIRNTFNERYGGYTYQSEYLMDKVHTTNILKFGTKNPASTTQVKEKRKETNLIRYGTKSSFSNKDVRAKYTANFISKYGVSFPMHVPEFFEKAQSSRFKPKEYIFMGGESVWAQGYEPFALKLLEEQGYTSKMIATSTKTGIPSIRYNFEDRQRIYYPDIFLLGENKIIEVKSDYTYIKELGQNLAKKDACIQQGYDFEFWIFDQTGNKRLPIPQ